MSTETPLRVIIVEDDPLVSNVVDRLVRIRTPDVTCYASAQEAMEAMRQSQFDVVISDIRMPGMSGLELADWLRAERPEVTIVIMTGFSQQDAEDAAERLGAHLLRKPFKGPDLVEILDAAAAKRRSSS